MADRPAHSRQQSSLASPLLNRTKSLDEESLKSPVQDNDEGASFDARSQHTNMSSTAQIEQSVKLFKIVEALRSGSESQILKAIESTTGNTGKLEGTTILHLAIQVAEPKVSERVLLLASPNSSGKVDIELDVNSQDKDGNTPLILASSLGRASLVGTLLTSLKADVMVMNVRGKTALDVARTPEIYQMLQLERALITERCVKSIQAAVSKGDYDALQKILEDQKVNLLVDVGSPELPTDSEIVANGGSLLHEAAKKKDLKLAQLLLLNGADPFQRDKKGKLPQDITKDERTRAILKKSPAATAAQRGLQERTILGVSTTSPGEPHGKESREMKGYLKKWTNYTTGYKLRWFVLEDGVLSYYKHQDDAGSACRGAMNMRIAKLSMDAQDSTRFEIIGKSSVKYHLKANHTVEAKRWFWALNNAIQWAKDADRHDKKREKIIEDAKNQALSERRTSLDVDDAKRSSFEHSDTGVSTTTTYVQAEKKDDEGSIASIDPRTTRATAIPGDMDDEEEFVDDASAVEVQPVPKDAFNITAHSAHLQLELLGQVSSALSAQSRNAPQTQLSDPIVGQAIETYERAVRSLQSMVQDLLKISRDREAYWQFRLDREAEMRTLWEDSMAKVTREQEELETRIGESELKRRRTKKALKDVLGDPVVASSAGASSLLESLNISSPGVGETPASPFGEDEPVSAMIRRRSTVAAIKELSDSEDENDEEFFDAVGAGEIAAEPLASVIALPTPSATPSTTEPKVDLTPPEDKDKKDEQTIAKSFIGYEDPPRKRLAMDADNRPKISLWGILKSMIGKDMTKMTLPVSFNEPTSLLQRVAEDMEYTELLDAAVERADSTERMVYVAAFATSEYASTIGRVAKPFNPLLGETFEYSRPDKGYRFMVEQVSHHPPIGAAWAESARWTYWGESAVKSKFYGKSFDINPLGTWFLRLKPKNGEEELYTWKKVTTSVVGIITGSPTVDNYGPMIVKNWNTGDTCQLDFVQRGWKATSAYKVGGKVTTPDGRSRWSMGGRWNDKIFARLTPGFEADLLDSAKQSTSATYVPGSDQAFLVWAANPRPANIPFNLTPFGVTLNALPDKLRSILPPTDARLRPDQRAMEDGEYDLAATEKNRVEEKQRAKRREREEAGKEYVPRWFKKNTCKISGEEYWDWNVGSTYWDVRENVTTGKGTWEGVDDIF